MPRYFFNLQDGLEEFDTVGTELVDLEQAKRNAVMIFTQTLAELGAGFWDIRALRLDVLDESGLQVITLKLEGHCGT